MPLPLIAIGAVVVGVAGYAGKKLYDHGYENGREDGVRTECNKQRSREEFESTSHQYSMRDELGVDHFIGG